MCCAAKAIGNSQLEAKFTEGIQTFAFFFFYIFFKNEFFSSIQRYTKSQT